MATDEDEMWKPYIYEDADYGEIARKKSYDGEYARLKKLGVKGLKFSEFIKPYQPQTEDDDSHPPYEWTWPDYPWPINKIPGMPRIGDDPPHIGPCSELGCADTMLGCEGGCTTISCACFVPPLRYTILQDPTCGQVYVIYPGDSGGDGPRASRETPKGGKKAELPGPIITPTDPPQICVAANATKCNNGDLIVLVCDARNVCEKVTISLLNCDEPSYCCQYGGMTLTGADTVDPGSSWIGTIDPACPDATCKVIAFEESCQSKLTCAVSENGGSVTVYVADGACGAFRVQIGNETDCPGASKEVRINNTGQGGAWVQCGYIDIYNCTCTGCCKEQELGYHKVQVCRGTGTSCATGQGQIECIDDDNNKQFHLVDNNILVPDCCGEGAQSWCSARVYYWGNCSCA